MYGRRAHVPLERILGAVDNEFGKRLDDLSQAYRDNLQESRVYNRERMARRADVATSLNVGDTVAVKVEGGGHTTRGKLTTNWDPQYEVIRVHWLRHQVTGIEKKLHREKLLLVDPDVIWDELPPRV